VLDEASVAALYERHGHALYRRCLSLIGNPDDAQELLQETFAQFWQGLSRFEGRSAVFTYLYRIATNLAIDRLRRRTTAGVQMALDEGLHASHVGGGPDARASAASELANALLGLDEETVTVAVMAHVDGLTQDEIALALSLSRRTVGKRLKHFVEHARARTGQIFAVQLEGSPDGA